MSRYFKYSLFGTFLSAIVVIVILQFNTNRSITQFINGNKSLLQELQLKNDLLQLQSAIFSLDSKVSETVLRGESISKNHLEQEIKRVQQTLLQLKSVPQGSAAAPLIKSLGTMVDAKIAFNLAMIDTFSRKGENAANLLINQPYGKRLSNAIKTLAEQIDLQYQKSAVNLIKKVNSDGDNVQTLGTLMAMFAALAAIFTFGYIAYKTKEQQQLIAQLNTSEKKEKETVQVKEKFLSNMNHEIRTPLNAIIGFTHLLQQQPHHPKANQFLQNIHQSGENLLRLVNDLLDLSSIEAGMMQIQPAPFSIREVVQQSTDLFAQKATDKGLQLVVSVDDTLPAILMGDANRLKQLLVNLLDNALKFTQQGSIAVTVTNEGLQKGWQQTEITVSDTGIGITETDLPLIFERFHQAADGATHSFGGTGVGLSIVKELIRLQQGQIHVSSEPGKGTRFTIHLPYQLCAATTADTATTMVTATTLLQAPAYTLPILIAEDDPMNQELLAHVLHQWNIEFDIVDNGKAVLEELVIKKYQLILMDIQMPVMDGYTAAQQIREHLELPIPIIAMTAFAMAEEKEKCLALGITDYLSKPVQEQQLLALLNQYHTNQTRPAQNS